MTANSSARSATIPTRAEPRLARLSDLLDDWEADAIATHAAHETGQLRGPVTQLKKLDTELGGVLQPGLHHVHGGPGVGKTAFGLQIAATCGFPAVYLTCEMSALELLRRHTARVTNTFLGRLKSGELPPERSILLARQGAAAAKSLAIADATQNFAPLEWIRTAALGVRGDALHLLVVVDSVHSWSEAYATDLSEYERLNAALSGLRLLAQELAVPVLAISERNRASMQNGGLSASAGTRRFEYSGESVLDLTAEKDATADAAGEIAITLTLQKNRHGPVGKKIGLKFNGALQRFREA